MAATLVIFKKSGVRKNIELRPGITILGRRPDCDVRISTQYVSRKHARIVCQDEKTVIQDLGSANGTFINSKRIIEAAINAGDQLMVGATVFTVQIDGRPEHISPPEPTEPVETEATDSAMGHPAGQSATLAADQSPVPTPAPATEQDALTDLEIIANDNSNNNSN